MTELQPEVTWILLQLFYLPKAVTNAARCILDKVGDLVKMSDKMAGIQSLFGTFNDLVST